MAESFIKIMRIKEMITPKEALIVQQNLLVSTKGNASKRVQRMRILTGRGKERVKEP